MDEQMNEQTDSTKTIHQPVAGTIQINHSDWENIRNIAISRLLGMHCNKFIDTVDPRADCKFCLSNLDLRCPQNQLRPYQAHTDLHITLYILFLFYSL